MKLIITLKLSKTRGENNEIFTILHIITCENNYTLYSKTVKYSKEKVVGRMVLEIHLLSILWDKPARIIHATQLLITLFSKVMFL